MRTKKRATHIAGNDCGGTLFSHNRCPNRLAASRAGLPSFRGTTVPTRIVTDSWENGRTTSWSTCSGVRILAPPAVVRDMFGYS